jgi:carboxylate-amine ligase
MRAGLAGGLHIHLGVPGADRLLAVYNALRGYMPEVAALAAAAPYFAGQDSGLASIRPKLADALPRQGVAPPLPNWAAFAEMLAWGARTGAFLDRAELWWECRLHPGFGTIEVRAPDVQAAIADVEVIATLVHALVRELAGRHAAGDQLPAHEAFAISENRWRAATDGVEGELIDLERMRLAPARERIRTLITRVADHAVSDRESRALERGLGRLDDPHPRRQRALAARGGVAALIAGIADTTEAV